MSLPNQASLNFVKKLKERLKPFPKIFQTQRVKGTQSLKLADKAKIEGDELLKITN